MRSKTSRLPLMRRAPHAQLATRCARATRHHAHGNGRAQRLRAVTVRNIDQPQIAELPTNHALTEKRTLAGEDLYPSFDLLMVRYKRLLCVFLVLSSSLS